VAIGQAAPERGDFTVSGVSDKGRRSVPPGGEFIDHL